MTKDKIENAANNPLIELLSKREVFISGALSPEAKEYWQKGMYSEEEVKELCDQSHLSGYNLVGRINRENQFEKWFNQNKKK